MTSSYAFKVRDNIIVRMKAMQFFDSFSFKHTNDKQIQPGNLPLAAVYFMSEDMTPDGDSNVGPVRFRSSATYGFSVIVENNDAEAAEIKLDEAYQTMTAMFVDPTLYDWDNVGVAGHAAIQAYTRASRMHQFGSIGADNSTPIAELRFTMTCDLGVIEFPFVPVDDFNTLHLTTKYPLGKDQSKIQQVQAEYDIPQN